MNLNNFFFRNSLNLNLFDVQAVTYPWARQLIQHRPFSLGDIMKLSSNCLNPNKRFETLSVKTNIIERIKKTLEPFLLFSFKLKTWFANARRRLRNRHLLKYPKKKKKNLWQRKTLQKTRKDVAISERSASALSLNAAQGQKQPQRYQAIATMLAVTFVVQKVGCIGAMKHIAHSI